MNNDSGKCFILLCFYSASMTPFLHFHSIPWNNPSPRPSESNLLRLNPPSSTYHGWPSAQYILSHHNLSRLSREIILWLSKFLLKFSLTKLPMPAEVRRLQQVLSHNTTPTPTLNIFETRTVTKAFHAPVEMLQSPHLELYPTKSHLRN